MIFTRFKTCLILFLFLVTVSGALAQGGRGHKIWLRVSDTGGGLDTLWFGVNLDATYGIDTLLGEQGSPPAPPQPGPFYTNWQDVGDHIELDQGLKTLDLRTFYSPTQIDTYNVYFVPGTPTPGMPVNFQWPDAAYLSDRCDSIVIENPITGARFNMMTQQTLTVTNRFHKNLYIYRYGAMPTSVRMESREIPASFSLQQNYPNPFNPSTTIKFEIKNASFTTVTIFDVLGRKISTLVSEDLIPGFYSTTWNALDDHGQSVPSGVYYVRMNSIAQDKSRDQGIFSDIRKLLLIK